MPVRGCFQVPAVQRGSRRNRLFVPDRRQAAHEQARRSPVREPTLVQDTQQPTVPAITPAERSGNAVV